MTSETYPRKIKLRPYGLVFWRHQLIDKGVNPAIYINSIGTTLKKYLIGEFNKHFEGVNALKKLKAKGDFYREIVHYYSLINIIAENHDFSWEREWRHNGNFKFKYRDVVAIVADDPESFGNKCKREINSNQFKYIEKIPIISPHWGYEEVIEELSIRLWQEVV